MIEVDNNQVKTTENNKNTYKWAVMIHIQNTGPTRTAVVCPR